MKALIVAKRSSLKAGLAWLDAQASAPAGSDGVKKAFSSRTLTHNTLAAVALIVGVEPDQLAYRVRAGAGRIPLSGAATPGLFEMRAKELAYRAWVQLHTRVVAHPIDWKIDDLVHVYDSWHECFRRLRELLEEAALWRDPDTALAKQILNELTDLLNGTLRPHLTRHSSGFRHWLDEPETEKAAPRALRPQERQSRYPDWQTLTADFSATQAKAAACAMRLHEHLFPPASLAKKRAR